MDVYYYEYKEHGREQYEKLLKEKKKNNEKVIKKEMNSIKFMQELKIDDLNKKNEIIEEYLEKQKKRGELKTHKLHIHQKSKVLCCVKHVLSREKKFAKLNAKCFLNYGTLGKPLKFERFLERFTY